MSFPPLENPNPPLVPPSETKERLSTQKIKSINEKLKPQSFGDFFMTCCGFRKPPKKLGWVQLPSIPPPEPVPPPELISHVAKDSVEKVISQAFLNLYGRMPYPEEISGPPQIENSQPSISTLLNEVISGKASLDEDSSITAHNATQILNKLIRKLPEDLVDKDIEDLKTILQNPEKVVLLHLQNNRLLDPFQFLTILRKTSNLSAINLTVSSHKHNFCRSELKDLILAETWINNCLTILKKPGHSPLLHTLKISHAAPGPLRYVLDRHPDLICLGLSHCPDIGTEDYKSFAEVCRNLNSLHVRGEFNNAGEGIGNLIVNNPELDVLKLSNLKGFTKNELLMIAKSTSDLKELHIYGTENIDTKVLSVFRTNNPGLAIRITMTYKDRSCMGLF